MREGLLLSEIDVSTSLAEVAVTLFESGNDGGGTWELRGVLTNVVDAKRKIEVERLGKRANVDSGSRNQLNKSCRIDRDTRLDRSQSINTRTHG